MKDVMDMVKCDFSKIKKCNRTATKTYETNKRTLHLCYIHYQAMVDLGQNIRLSQSKERTVPNGGMKMTKKVCEKCGGKGKVLRQKENPFLYEEVRCFECRPTPLTLAK